MEEEVWKDIKDFEGSYQISNFGRVKSLSRSIKKRGRIYTYKELILKPDKSNTGYLRVALLKEGKHIKFSVHRLVAQYFIPNLENKPQVNHIDGRKDNNNVCNLEWNTPSENQLHASKNGLMSPKRGCQSSTAKLTKEQVIQIRYDYNIKNIPIFKLAIEYEVSYYIIFRVVKNMSYKNEV